MIEGGTRLILGMHRVAALNDRVLKGMRRRLKTQKHSGSEQQILLALFEEPDRSDRDVCNRLGMAPAQFSRNTNSLIHRKLVEVSAHPRHRSQRLLRLSGQGCQIAGTLRQLTVEAFDGEFAELTPAEQECLTAAVLASPIEREVSPFNHFDVRAISLREWGWLLDTAGSQARLEYNWSQSYSGYVAGLIGANIRQPQPAGPLAWVATRDRQPVGACLLNVGVDPIRATGDALTGWMPLIFVEPEHRCLGIGNRLLQECVKAARDMSVISIDVSVASSQKSLSKFLFTNRFKGRHAAQDRLRFGQTDTWREYSLKLGKIAGIPRT